MTYAADVDTTAAQVVKGDYIRIITGNRDYAMLVDTVQIGSKWTVARDAEGALIFRKPNDEQTWVMREVKTEEELTAEKVENERKVAEWHEEMLTKMLARMYGGIANAKQAMALSLEKGFVDVSAMEDIVIEQEYKTIACTIDHAMGVHEEWTVMEAMNAVADRIKESLINGGIDEPTQSGGFTFNNAARQTKIAARRKFLQGITWGTLS